MNMGKCNDCQDTIRNLTVSIYYMLKPYHEKHIIDDQTFVYISASLKKIENQVASKNNKLLTFLKRRFLWYAK